MNDPNKTQMIPQPLSDPNRTQAMSITPIVPSGNFSMIESLRLQIIPGRTATMANGPAREQFMIELFAPGNSVPSGMGQSSQRTALNVCLVLDRSGSMEGPPLEYAKMACYHVVDLLGSQDMLSIVVFSDQAELLLAPHAVTSRELIRDGIARVTHGNTTNLFEALNVAANQLSVNIESKRATRMIVLSDGDPTEGIKDFPSLMQLGESIRSKGISATFLGFGPDYNEELLAGLAKKTAGNYAYIPSPQMIPEVFRFEMDKLMSVAATNIHLEFETARWVNFRGGSAGYSEVEPGKFLIDLSDLEIGSTMQQVLDFEFPNHPIGHYRIANGFLSYDDAFSGQRQRVPVDFVAEFTSDSSRYSAPVNSTVAAAWEVASMSRAVEKTMMGLKAGNITIAAAVQDLQKTQAILISQDRQSEAQEVASALRSLQSGDQSGAEKTLMGTVVQLDQGKK